MKKLIFAVKGDALKRFLPFIGYLILTSVVFFHVLWPGPGQILFGPDIWRYHYWERQFFGAALKEGSIPWWNPYIFAGQPYLEHPQIPAWYLPNLLFVLVPANMAVSWYVAFHIFWAMAGMYCAIRAMSNVKFQISNMGAWAAGVSFGLSGYFVGRIYAGHIDIIAASAWMPWVVWASVKCQVSRVNEWKKWCIVAAGVFAMQLLSGHQMVAVYTVEAVMIVASFVSYFEKSWRPLFRTGLAVLIGIALAAVQLLPNQQLVARSIRTMPLGQAWSVIAAARPAHLLELLDTGYFYTTIYKDIADDGLGHERSGYIGKVPLFIALTTLLYAFIKRPKRPEVWTFVAIAIFSIWVWLGPHAPVDIFAILQKTLPVYGQIRIPSRHIVLFVLAGSALFGIGMGRIKNSFIQFVLVGLVLIDLVPLAWQNIHMGAIPQQAEDKELIALLTRDGRLTRLLPNFYHGELLRDILEFDAPTAHKIFSVSGYDQPPLRNYYEFLLAVNNLDIRNNLQYIETIPPFPNIRSSYLDFLNVGYILVPRERDEMLRADPHRFSLVGESETRGWRLYKNSAVLPRFYFVPSATTLPNRTAIDRATREGTSDPRKTVLIERTNVPTPAHPCTQDDQPEVNVVSYRPAVIQLETRSTCDAWLVSSEVYYPGWTGDIDGKKTQVLEGNLAFRTMFVPKGTHTIVMRYRPTVALWGLLISVATAIGCFLWTRVLLFAK